MDWVEWDRVYPAKTVEEAPKNSRFKTTDRVAAENVRDELELEDCVAYEVVVHDSTFYVRAKG